MKYPIGVQSFEVLRKDGYVYVDKTDLIYKLAEEHICFLSRPRRFGKSLLLSTLKAYFEGKRELFHGLMIELLEKEWKKYPVLLFDFNGVDLSRKNGLREYLSDVMQEAEDRYHLPMIFQGGYLTIKDYDADFGTYLLDFPNAEVKEGFVTLLVNNYLQMKDDTASWVSSIVKSLRVGHLEETRRIFTAFLAEIPYTMRPKKESEFYFHYTFYLLMRLISCYTVYTEKQLSEGRADCIVETDDYVYIFEFKLDGTAGEALRQIRDRGYDKSYLADSRKVYLIGASFSSQTGTIDDWLTEG